MVLLWLKYARHSINLKRAAACVVPAVLLSLVFVPDLIRDLCLAVAGTSTAGIVWKKEMITAGSRVQLAALFARTYTPTYRLAYRFSVNGQWIMDSAYVSRSRWLASGEGMPVEVVYLPADPRVHRAGSPIWLSGDMFGLLLAAAPAFGVVLFLWLAVRNIGRKIALIMEGVPTCGVIDKVKVGYSSTFGIPFVEAVKYTFLVDDARGRHLRHEILESDIPYRPRHIHQGDYVLVLYDAVDPARHAIDCFDVRRDERLKLCVDSEPVLRPSTWHR